MAHQIMNATLGHKSCRVGLVYDEDMINYHHIWNENFPEKPERFRVCLEKCKELNLVEKCYQIPPRKATKSEILLQHTEEYYNVVERSANMNEEELKTLSTKYDGVYFHPNSFHCALLSAGCAIEAVDHILQDKVDSSLTITRPPGHHAMPDQGSGYCYFNNVAVATSHALLNFDLQRVLVVDWDLHHGQGIQDMFYDDPRVLYFSIHRYEHGLFWPNLRRSDYDFVGGKGAEGFNVNVPINKVDLKDGDYMAIFQRILMPIAMEFQPELVIVACGFDVAIGDPEGHSEVTPQLFAHLTHMLKGVCEGRLCLVLEGGYCMKSLSQSLALTLRCLLDYPCPAMPPLVPPLDSTVESILNCIRVHRPFWKCLAFQGQSSTTPAGRLQGQCSPAVGQARSTFTFDDLPVKGLQFADTTKPPDAYDFHGYEVWDEDEEARLNGVIDELIQSTILIDPPNRTCIGYDECMLLHKPTSGSHPERSDRLRRVRAKLVEDGWWEKCMVLEPRTATVEEICLNHDLKYVEDLEAACKMGDGELDELNSSFEFSLRSVYLNKHTYSSALSAVGCLLNVLDDVMTGKSQNGFALIRPPGHHAERNQYNGFCFFNSVAIGAHYAKLKYHVKRIMILDWDVHHGNGTQSSFYDDDSVLFVSIHRRDDGRFYPNGLDNMAERVGKFRGEGFNINVPWSKGKQGDAEYMAVFQQIVMPVAYEFGPELVLVSAGFDAAIGDPLGGCCISADGFAHMTHMLSSLASGRLVLALEGGYNLNSLSQCASACVSVMLGTPPPQMELDRIRQRSVEDIQNVIGIHKRYWKSLTFDVDLPSRESTLVWLGKQMDDWERMKYKTIDGDDDGDGDRFKKEINHGHSDDVSGVNNNNNNNNGDNHNNHNGDDNGDDNGNDGDDGENDVTDLASKLSSELLINDSEALKANINRNKDDLIETTCLKSPRLPPPPSQPLPPLLLPQPPSPPPQPPMNTTNNIDTVSFSITTSLPPPRDTSSLPQPSSSSSSSSSSLATAAAVAISPPPPPPTPSSSSASLHPYNHGNEMSLVDDEFHSVLNALSLGQDNLGLYAVQPLEWCPHLDLIKSNMARFPALQLVTESPCSVCEDVRENWVCLTCFEVYCSRFVNYHMLEHANASQHPLALSYSDLSVWCYHCDYYVDNEIIRPAKASAYRSKFHCELPHV